MLSIRTKKKNNFKACRYSKDFRIYDKETTLVSTCVKNVEEK